MWLWTLVIRIYKNKVDLQFSLRTVVLVVTAVCVYLAFVQTEVNKKCREARAVERIQQAGAFVETREPDEEGWRPALIRRLAPECAKRGAAYEVFGHRLSRRQMESILLALDNLPDLKRVTLSGAVIDDDIATIARAPKLRAVGLQDTQVTDAGLTHLSGCRTLVNLGTNSAVTGRTLKRLPNLVHLDLYFADVDDEGLERIGELHSLEYLAVGGEQMTDEGVRQLHHLRQLETLFLVTSRVSDEAVEQLAAMLSECRIVWHDNSVEGKTRQWRWEDEAW